MSEIVCAAERAMLDLANLILIRNGKRRKIVADDYVLFERSYYFETYGLEENNGLDAGGNSLGGSVGDKATGEDE